MGWLLIDRDTHEIVSGPHEEKPSEGIDAYATQVMIGWPRDVDWVPALRGFVRHQAPRPLTRLGYQRLFTQSERIAVRGSSDPIVVDFRELAAMAEEIDLDDPDVIAGTNYLEMTGLLETGRAAIILANSNATAG